MLGTDKYSLKRWPVFFFQNGNTSVEQSIKYETALQSLEQLKPQMARTHKTFRKPTTGGFKNTL